MALSPQAALRGKGMRWCHNYTVITTEFISPFLLSSLFDHWLQLSPSNSGSQVDILTWAQFFRLLTFHFFLQLLHSQHVICNIFVYTAVLLVYCVVWLGWIWWLLKSFPFENRFIFLVNLNTIFTGHMRIKGFSGCCGCLYCL